jgi:hypothetical protein
MSFRVGQKVVCISDYSRWEPRAPLEVGTITPVKGEIYTVRGVCESPSGVGLWLEEIVNKPRRYRNGYLEIAFNIKSFRPIDYSFGEKVCEEIEFENFAERIKIPIPEKDLALLFPSVEEQKMELRLLNKKL